MNQPQSPIRDVSDTALWMAVYRARETERADAVFRDPLARRLAGQRGEEIARSMPFADRHSWPYVARTWLMDRCIAERVKQGTEMVLNLAAGLDTRPYRLDLPSSLEWIEVDFSEILERKGETLQREKPVCRLERIPLDLRHVSARRDLFSRLGRRNPSVLVVSEGLLAYWSEEEVALLGRDLAAQPSFHHWIVDLVSPVLLRMLAGKMGGLLDRAGTPLRFAPDQGPDFFTRLGWEPKQTVSCLHCAARLKRLPLLLRLLARIVSPRFQARRPWGGVCLLARR